jgi:hypothetical protein
LKDLKDVMRWPVRVLRGVRAGDGFEDQEAELRMKMLYQGEIIMTTDYSGWDCPRWCLHAIALALVEEWGWPADIVNKIKFVRACDYGEIQQQVLCEVAMKIDKSESCVLVNMMDRLPQTAKDIIMSACPGDDATLTQKADAHEFIYQWLESNRQWVFPIGATSPCEVHGTRCSVHPYNDLPPDVAASPDRPSIFTTAGVTCHAWSMEGSREGDAHHSAIFNAIWQIERIARAENNQEDGAFFECTHLYPIQAKIADRVQSTHFVVWVYVNPPVQAFPSRRSRVLAFMGNRKTIRWSGPASPQEIQSDFDRRFGLHCDLSGSMFFCASDAERWPFFLLLMRNRTQRMKRKRRKASEQEQQHKRASEDAQANRALAAQARGKSTTAVLRSVGVT